MRTLLWMGMLTSLCYALPAQVRGKTGTIVVEVKDEGGGIVRNAQVQILPSPNTIGKDLTTDGDGQLSLNLPIGSYELTVTLPGFRPYSKHIVVENDTKQRVDAILKVDSCPPGPCNTITSVPAQLLPSRPAPRFSLEIHAQQERARLGSPIAMTVTTTNRSGQNWFVSSCHELLLALFDYDVFDADGKMPRRTEMGRNIIDDYPGVLVGGHCPVRMVPITVRSGPEDIEIGDGQSFKPDVIALSDLFVFEPGNYTVQLGETDEETKTTVRSNAITLTVIP